MIYDLAIIGGGPAGVAAGVYASRKRLKTVFITDSFIGQSAVSDGIENWIGTIKISGTELAENLKKHLQAYAGDVVDIKEGLRASSIEKKDGSFIIKTTSDTNNTFEAKTLLITTGSTRRKLEAKGAEEFDNKGLTYCATCDGPLFADQDVAVIGGGNAAFETAAQLLAYCKSVTLLNRTDQFRADQVTIDKLSKNPKFKIITNAPIDAVIGDKFVNGIIYTDKTTNQKITLPTNGIFVEIGLIPNTSFLKEVVELNQIGQIVVDPRNQRTKTEGIWAAGDVTDGLYHQNNIAAGDAVKALEDIFGFIHTK
ncbi:MAG: FAD-dependent oxidoreductase [bacterium]